MLSQIIFQNGEVINQSSPKGFWDYLVPILPALVGIGALIIAYRSYRSYDVKKHILKYQLDAVFELVKELQNSTWYVKANYKEGGSTYFTLTLSRIQHMLNDKDDDNLLRSRLYVSVKTLFNLKLFGFSKNEFVPKPIADQIEKLQLWSGVSTATESELNDERGVFLSMLDEQGRNKKEITFSKNGEIIDDLGNGYVFQTLYNYCNELMILQSLLDRWLDKFDVPDLNTKPRKF